MEHARVDLDSSARPMIHVFNCLLTLQVMCHKPGEERVTESEENELPRTGKGKEGKRAKTRSERG